MKIQTILILIEIDNGHVHQVLTSNMQKETCMALLRSDDGVLRLSARVEPVMIERRSAPNGQDARPIPSAERLNPRA